MAIKKLPKWHRVVLDVDPFQGAAALAVAYTPKGYSFHSMIRRGTKATIKYIRKDC